jgi:tripartite-type tricarboxylate transporter receptor subunit TctC
MSTRRQFLAGLTAIAKANSGLPARADTWPQRVVKIIMPFPPGGNSDILGRVIGQRLSESLGQQFIVENRPGGMGAIAAEAVARAPADGYTLFWAALPQIAIFPAMTKVTYDPVKDFSPISDVGTNPFVLVVHPTVPVSTMKEFVDYVRSQPGKLSYGSGGTGTLSHLSMVLLMKRADLDMVHIPYKGGGPAMADLVAGQVKIYFGNLSEVLPHVQAHALRPIAVTSEKRVAQLPDVPTVSESGFPGYRTITWNGLMAPAGTPREIVDKVAREVADAVKQPAIIERLYALGVEPLGDTPEQFAATVAADIPMWAEAVKISGATIQQ